MILRRTFTILITLIITMPATAGNTVFNQKDTVNQRDLNNEKQGYWIVYNVDGKYKGYTEGQLVEEGEYLNNRKTGVWTKYYPNGSIKHELTFANNVANGYAKIYYRTGQLQEEGIWKVNRWVGQYKYYYEDGTMQYDWSYNSSGKREGEQHYFYNNGMIKYVGDWANGQESGELKEYYDDGSIKAVRYFNKGKVQPEQTVNHVKGKEFDGNEKLFSGIQKTKTVAQGQFVDGFNRVMNPDGTVLMEGKFKNRKIIDGKRYVYEEGKVVRTVIYADGSMAGEETIE